MSYVDQLISLREEIEKMLDLQDVGIDPHYLETSRLQIILNSHKRVSAQWDSVAKEFKQSYKALITMRRIG